MASLIELLGEEPVTLDQAKQQVRIPVSDDESTMETLLSLYIKVARQVAENWTWRGLVNGNYLQVLDEFPDIIEVEKAPLHDVAKIEYYNSSDTLTELSPDSYRVDTDSEPGRIEPVSSWPATKDRIGAVRITFEGGYEMGEESGAESTCPEALKAAILLLVERYYDHRDAIVVSDRSSIEAIEVPFGVRMILDAYSLRRF